MILILKVYTIRNLNSRNMPAKKKKKKICKVCGCYITDGNRMVYCSTECSLKSVRKSARKYAEKYREQNENRRLKLRFRIFQKSDFSCSYCGRRPPECVLEVDHKYPKAKGGKNEEKNYVSACRECNIGKGDIILNEFK